MTATVLKPGLQTTIQGRARTGYRHLGVPACGPADPLSMALANRLLENPAAAAALETTLNGVTLRFDTDACVAIAGATADCHLNDALIEQHQAVIIRAGDVLSVGAARDGMRSYIAVAGGFAGSDFLGSVSTYLPGKFGGHQGRALQAGDELAFVEMTSDTNTRRTPDEFRLPMPGAWTIRTTASSETATVKDPRELFDTRFTVSRRSDRMGAKLDGGKVLTSGRGDMDSVPVFPGTIQCPQDGSPYLLSVDAGTTGGYPRIGKICRLDLHLLGQLRPGNSVTLIKRDEKTAAEELLAKHAYWRRWIPEIVDVL